MSINDNRIINIIDKFQKLTEKSTRELQINSQLNLKLNNSKTKLLTNENKIDELITKSANLDIFLEHLTSLILRSEFLESQLNNFERSIIDNSTIYSSTKDESFDGSLLDPNKKLHLDWRTTQTTYENLCLEYKYLSDQIKLANGYFPTSTKTISSPTTNITPSDTDTHTPTSSIIPNHETHNHVLNRLQSNCSSNLTSNRK
ncbi:unnamed protein product [[Candida] boidinii]|nr:unnamed protein product [[Candida] boidinii]